MAACAKGSGSAHDRPEHARVRTYSAVDVAQLAFDGAPECRPLAHLARMLRRRSTYRRMRRAGGNVRGGRRRGLVGHSADEGLIDHGSSCSTLIIRRVPVLPSALRLHHTMTLFIPALLALPVAASLATRSGSATGRRRRIRLEDCRSEAGVISATRTADSAENLMHVPGWVAVFDYDGDGRPTSSSPTARRSPAREGAAKDSNALPQQGAMKFAESRRGGITRRGLIRATAAPTTKNDGDETSRRRVHRQAL